MKLLAKAGATVVAVSVLSLTAFIGHATSDPVERAAMHVLTEVEGITLVQYNDSAGLATCGVGHLLKPGERCPSTLGEAMKVLADDTRAPGLRESVNVITECVPDSSGDGFQLQCRMRRVARKHGGEVDAGGPNGLSAGRNESLQQGAKPQDESAGSQSRSSQSARSRSAHLEV